MENKNPHSGHRKRLREQVLKSGLDSLHEHQVLEYLLTFVLPQKDTNQIAHELISNCGGFSQVFETDVNDLMKIKGVGEVVAHFLYNFRDFFYYYQKSKTKLKPTLRNSREFINYIRAYFSNKTREEVYLICVDDKNRVLETKLLAKGTTHTAPVIMQDVIKIMLRVDCNSFILAHNHPFGKSFPSAEDNKLTRACYLNACMNNFKMLDHIIIGENDAYSYFQDKPIWESIIASANQLALNDSNPLSKNAKNLFAKYEEEE